MIKHILKEGPEGTYHRRGDVEEWRINPYEVTTTNYKELFDAIDKLPDTIRSINVPIELSLFNPSQTKFVPKNESDWKKKVKEIILGNIRRGDIMSYSVNSYYGTTSKEYDNHPYYISFELPGSKEFGERMSSGEHGSLD